MLATIAVLGACGDDDAGSSATSTSTSPSTTTSPSVSGKQIEMPDVVDERLSAAERKLEAVGLLHQATNPSRRVTGSNWVVCKTNPPAELVIPTGIRVELVVARPGGCSDIE